MAHIFPFTALRPVPRAAAAVAAVPYDVVSAEDARRLAEGNPLSFLHVSRAEIDLPPGTDPYSDQVYERANENFRDLRARAPLIVEDAPSVYVYRLEMGGHVQGGVAACFSLDEYDADVIKKHEKTRPDKEDDRTRHMLAIGAQTGPVFLTYAASAPIDALSARAMTAAPLFDFAAPDEVKHTIWRISDQEAQAFVRAFDEVGALYIADGHHRAASAARTRRALSGRGMGEHDRMLAVAFPDTQVQILPYNRVIRDLNGLTPEEFLERLRSHATIQAGGPASSSRKGQVGVYLDGAWHTIQFSSPGDAEGAATLDVTLLQDLVLGPILGVGDVRTDKRIDFVGGLKGTRELQRLVDSGEFAVAFSMHPVTIHDLMRIADEGGIMPPKSTWFEPKLRDGLLSHLI